MKRILVILGVCLILASLAIFAYENLASYTPLLGSGNEQSASVNYVAFFGLAVGGAGVLILLFAFLQWFRKRGPEHGFQPSR